MKTIKLLIITLLFSNLTFGQCWTKVDTSGNSTIGLRIDGSLWSWGINSSGVLGLGLQPDIFTPLSPAQIGTDNDWSENYSISSNITLAIKTNGLLFAWGNNENGQAGNGTSGSQNFILAPQQIGTDTWKAVASSAGSSYSLGVKTDGSLWAWGKNEAGQLGTGNLTPTTTPTRIENDNDWAKVFSANRTSYAIKNDGTLWSWGGYNSNYLLGYLGTQSESLTPHQVGTSNNWVTIATESNFVIGLQSNGTLWAWGINPDQFYAGFYGNGNPDTNNYRNNPTQIGTDTDWVHVDISNQNSFATKSNGTLWGWGINTQGRLGDGTTVTRYIPTQLNNDSDWAFVNAGADVGNQFYALKNNHALYMWGQPNTIQTLQGNTCNLSTVAFNTESIQVFPNPTANQLFIHSNTTFDSPTEITISNTLGQTIKSSTILPSTSGNIEIDLSSFEKGLYLVRIKNENLFNTQKIIKN